LIAPFDLPSARRTPIVDFMCWRAPSRHCQDPPFENSNPATAPPVSSVNPLPGCPKAATLRRITLYLSWPLPPAPSWKPVILCRVMDERIALHP
jgi:hypothetical protein